MTPPNRRDAAFTLIELLVVIVIIGALVAITLTVGQGVVQGQRGRLAQDRIRVVDIAIDSYIRDTGSALPTVVRVPSPLAGAGTNPAADVLIPMADAANFNGISSDDDRTIINTIGLLGRAFDDAGVPELLQSLEGEALEFFDPDAGPDGGGLVNAQPELRTVVDPWGRPLRVVHPRFDGIIRQTPATSVADPGDPVVVNLPQVELVTEDDLPDGFDAGVFGTANFPITEIRRNRITDADREADPSLVGDSDGGICPGGRPYVYSAGVDGDPSTLDDNAYTTEPTISQD